MAKDLLLRQLTHRYGAAERSLTVGVDEASARRTLGGRPPLMWHARHLADAVDVVAEAVLGAPLGLDPLGGDGHPFGGAGDGAAAGVRRALLDRFGAMLAGLRALPASDLELPPAIEVLPAFRESLATRAAFLEGHVYHVAYHVGSMAVLRAEFGLDRS